MSNERQHFLLNRHEFRRTFPCFFSRAFPYLDPKLRSSVSMN